MNEEEQDRTPARWRAPPGEVDLPAYLARIDYRGAVAPDLRTLTALQLHHVTHIPFENIDVQLGRPVPLDLASVQEKLVRAKRGGYCFEHNTLFAAVLEAVGFPVVALAARVRYQATEPTPRTHMLLLVEADGARYLVDTAFGGGWGPTAPIELAFDRVQDQDLASYRLSAAGDVYRLSVCLDDGFSDLYELTLEPQLPVDFELANHFTSTHPSSRFVQSLIVTMPGPGVRYVLRDWEFSIRTASGRERRTLGDEGELREVLQQVFRITCPAGTLRALSARR